MSFRDYLLEFPQDIFRNLKVGSLHTLCDWSPPSQDWILAQLISRNVTSSFYFYTHSKPRTMEPRTVHHELGFFDLQWKLGRLRLRYPPADQTSFWSSLPKEHLVSSMNTVPMPVDQPSSRLIRNAKVVQRWTNLIKLWISLK